MIHKLLVLLFSLWTSDNLCQSEEFSVLEYSLDRESGTTAYFDFNIKIFRTTYPVVIKRTIDQQRIELDIIGHVTIQGYDRFCPVSKRQSEFGRIIAFQPIQDNFQQVNVSQEGKLILVEEENFCNCKIGEIQIGDEYDASKQDQGCSLLLKFEIVHTTADGSVFVINPKVISNLLDAESVTSNSEKVMKVVEIDREFENDPSLETEALDYKALLSEFDLIRHGKSGEFKIELKEKQNDPNKTTVMQILPDGTLTAFKVLEVYNLESILIDEVSKISTPNEPEEIDEADENEEPEETTGIDTESNGNHNLGAIIGGTIGVAVLIAVVIVIAVVCNKRRNEQRRCSKISQVYIPNE